MRPSRIREAASVLKDIVEESRALNVLKHVMSGNTVEEEILAVSSYIARSMGEAGADAKELAEKVGLDDVSRPTFWDGLLAGHPEETREPAGRKLARVQTTYNLLGTLRSLLAPAEKDLPHNSGKEHFTLILADLNGGTRPAHHVRDALNAVEKLYEVQQTMQELNRKDGKDKETSPLEVATVETGSELAFVFLGSAPVITAVGGLLFILWDRIKFSDERSFTKQTKVVSESLDLVEEIENKKEEIGKRKAEKLKRQVIDSARTILSTGAIPEQNQVAYEETAKRITSDETRALPEDQHEKESNRNKTQDS